jgi:hypothetical protein
MLAGRGVRTACLRTLFGFEVARLYGYVLI